MKKGRGQSVLRACINYISYTKFIVLLAAPQLGNTVQSVQERERETTRTATARERESERPNDSDNEFYYA